MNRELFIVYKSNINRNMEIIKTSCNNILKYCNDMRESNIRTKSIINEIRARNM